ncbi:hypothetical protein [Chromobacterium sp. ASV23]|uniref:hypothetical protein n=1 Tax=Chromobacterium sp. ASV23 TaxID=2795110 RepID=UPI0018EB63C0|nr:hypothetical protein [Chromobacterium sp. ASV23]
MNSPQATPHSTPSSQRLPNWRSAGKAPNAPIQGQSVFLLPLDPPRHGEALFKLFANDEAHWAHLLYGAGQSTVVRVNGLVA